MPAGIPVGTRAIGRAGAVNAGLLAVAILAGEDAQLASRLKAFRAKQTKGALDHPDPSVEPPATGRRTKGRRSKP
jgi:5-(carboxyamino)imidazole ribonucleotide mutase